MRTRRFKTLGRAACWFLGGNALFAAGAWAVYESARESEVSEAAIAAVCGLVMSVWAVACAGLGIWLGLRAWHRLRYDRPGVADDVRTRADRRRRVGQWVAGAAVAVFWAGVVAGQIPDTGWKCFAPPPPPPDRTDEIRQLREEVESLRKQEQELQAAAESAFTAYRRAKELMESPLRPVEGPKPDLTLLRLQSESIQMRLNGIQTRVRRTEEMLGALEREQAGR